MSAACLEQAVADASNEDGVGAVDALRSADAVGAVDAVGAAAIVSRSLGCWIQSMGATRPDGLR